MAPFFQAIIGDTLTMVAIIAILAGIMKIFQIATSLNEIKDLLRDIKRGTEDYSPVAGASRQRAFEPSIRPIDSASEAESIIRASVLEPER